MKKIIYLLLCLLLLLTMSGCKKKEKKLPELVEDNFMVLSTHQEGDIDEIKDYEVNISISQNGKVVISADNFKKWYAEGAYPTLEFFISEEQVSEIKDAIVKYDFYSMNANVGSRDMLEGEFRAITVQAVDNTYSTYGLNISNRKFNALYDFVFEQIREQYYRFVGSVNKIQQDALDLYNRRGVSVYNIDDQKILSDSDIVSFEKIPAENGPVISVSTNTDALDVSDYYYVSFTLSESGMEKFSMMEYDEDEVTQYHLFVDGEYAYNIIVNYKVDKKLFISQLYNEGDAARIAENLNQKLVR